MTTTALTDNPIESYLERLADALDNGDSAEKSEILQEIRAHIVDSVAGSDDHDAAIDRVLRLLGGPEELAQRYRTESLLARASRSYSPFLLLQTSWRWARLGIRGTMVFLLALFGYLTALTLTVSIFLKVIMPTRVGMWVGPYIRVGEWTVPRSVNIGSPSDIEGMHEVLGQWFVPVIAVSAFAIAVGTTQGLRKLMGKRVVKPAY